MDGRVMKTKFYLHGSKDSNRDLGESLGLTASQIKNFAYAGYEVEFDIEIGNDGQAFATHVNRVALTKMVKI